MDDAWVIKCLEKLAMAEMAAIQVRLKVLTGHPEVPVWAARVLDNARTLVEGAEQYMREQTNTPSGIEGSDGH